MLILVSRLVEGVVLSVVMFFLRCVMLWVLGMGMMCGLCVRI